MADSTGSPAASTTVPRPAISPAISVVPVSLGERSYEVHVGAGAIDLLPQLIPRTAKRVAVVTQAGIPLGTHARIAAVIESRGLQLTRIEISDGEAHKTLTTIEHLMSSFAAAGLTRHDVVVAVGGGVVTDVGGFAAALWHRGIPVLQVATTLLGMVDAAIGGKTGVNLTGPQAGGGGKNLIGAFWQPAGVICDLDALATLPERERRSGDGEMAKYHFLTGEDLQAMTLERRIVRCVEIKAAVVSADEREDPAAGAHHRGGRAVLNYGHTLAHALETATDHALTHGEAVGVGLVFAARLAERLGRIGAGRVDQHVAVVGELYGLPTEIPDGLDPAALLTLMTRDKKAVDGLTFVLDGPDGVELVAGVPREAVAATL